MPNKLSLVIPTYNEAINIAKLCQTVVSILDEISFDFEIIVVDDNSPDATWKIVENLTKYDARVKLVRRMHERGLASAVVSGWKVSQGEFLGVIDADLQHPPGMLKEMVSQLVKDREIDILVASRYVAGGKFLSKSLWQNFRSQLAIFLGLIFLPKIFRSIRDPLSGYFILRKEVIADKHLKPMGYKILLDVLAKGHYKKVYELPYAFGIREGGRTKADWKQYFIFLFQLIKLKFGGK